MMVMSSAGITSLRRNSRAAGLSALRHVRNARLCDCKGKEKDEDKDKDDENHYYKDKGKDTERRFGE